MAFRWRSYLDDAIILADGSFSGEPFARIYCSEDYQFTDIVYCIFWVPTITRKFEGPIGSKHEIFRAQQWAEHRFKIENQSLFIREPRANPTPRIREAKRKRQSIDFSQFDGFQTEASHNFSEFEVAEDPIDAVFNDMIGTQLGGSSNTPL